MDLTWVISNKHKILSVDTILYQYRQHAESVAVTDPFYYKTCSIQLILTSHFILLWLYSSTVFNGLNDLRTEAKITCHIL